MFIDVHAHLVDEKYESPKEVVERANFFGVDRMICASASYETSCKSVEFASITSGVYCTVGVHPEDCIEYDEVEFKLKELLNNEKVIAVGEIGLDYHYENYDKEKQKEVFEKQIFLAYEAKLPIVIHSRDAMNDTLEILKRNKDKLIYGGVFHCYSGSIEEAKEILKLGFSFSFGGVCTFKNARKVVEVLDFLPVENILLETDCPYLAPTPHRGELNEPKYIPLIAEKIAEIKNLKLEEIATITTKNAERIFKI
jgi:TatD DNase family protein